MTLLYPVFVLVGLALPAAIAGLATRSLSGAAHGFLWGGLVRICVVHHVTWLVNSWGHTMGSRAFASGDQSTNSVGVALLSFGEGWHNNHHAFPTSVRHGLTPWQLDMTYLLIEGLARIGLVSDVKVPTARQMEKKAINPNGTARSSA